VTKQIFIQKRAAECS